MKNNINKLNNNKNDLYKKLNKKSENEKSGFTVFPKDPTIQIKLSQLYNKEAVLQERLMKLMHIVPRTRNIEREIEAVKQELLMVQAQIRELREQQFPNEYPGLRPSQFPTKKYPEYYPDPVKHPDKYPLPTHTPLPNIRPNEFPQPEHVPYPYREYPDRRIPGKIDEPFGPIM